MDSVRRSGLAWSGPFLNIGATPPWGAMLPYAEYAEYAECEEYAEYTKYAEYSECPYCTSRPSRLSRLSCHLGNKAGTVA